jgi:hypothetical protein
VCSLFTENKRNKKMQTCTTWSRILGHLGRFEAWDILYLGCFGALDVLRLGHFCILDVLRLGPYIFRRSVFRRYVLGRFVCAPIIIHT